MKYVLTMFFSVIVSIMLGSYLSALHHQLYNVHYEICKTKLIAENNYKTNQQAFDCVRSNASIKVLGTLLFVEGSVFE